MKLRLGFLWRLQGIKVQCSLGAMLSLIVGVRYGYFSSQEKSNRETYQQCDKNMSWARLGRVVKGHRAPVTAAGGRQHGVSVTYKAKLPLALDEMVQ